MAKKRKRSNRSRKNNRGMAAKRKRLRTRTMVFMAPAAMAEGNHEFVSDRTSIGHPAQNQADRHDALNFCINSMWANDDLLTITRVEGGDPGWSMTAK